MKYTLEFSEVTMKSMPETGRRIAVLGELFNQPRLKGEALADGFAVTASAYRRFMQHNALTDLSAKVLNDLDLSHLSNLEEVARYARDRITAAEVPEDMAREIALSLRRLLERCGPNAALTAQGQVIAGPLQWKLSDEASLQAQNDGNETLFGLCREAFAGLFTAKALRYRIDNASAFEAAVVTVRVRHGIPGIAITEDASGADAPRLASWRDRVEAHFGQRMHIQWMRYVETGEIFITEAWPAATSIL
jgi:phosphoenolpyruvate synthase/pyruvate phosphate dikinase